MLVPFATYEPVPSHSGPMSAHLGPVLHVQVGDGDCYGEFSNPANQASSTWWVSKAGELVQYVDSDLAAWTQAAGNFTWNGVETEGYPTEPLTGPQILTLARLYVWGHQVYGWPLSESEDPLVPGFGWHGMGGVAWGNHPGCPGDLRKPQRGAILYLASLALNPVTQGAPTMFTTDPVSGLAIATDADGALYVTPGVQDLVVQNLVNHPQWQAGEAESAGQNPCVGIAMEKDGDGSWGYTFFTKPASGVGSFGPYDKYHVNRNGTF